MSESPIAVVHALHQALASGLHGEALRPFFTADAVTVERPNALKPLGATSSLEAMLAASTAGASLLAEQTYEVHAAFVEGALAIVRLTWRGEVARAVGPFHAGQKLTAHIAQFIETRDGRVARIETYDCYEPFAGSGRS